MFAQDICVLYRLHAEIRNAETRENLYAPVMLCISTDFGYKRPRVNRRNASPKLTSGVSIRFYGRQGHDDNPEHTNLLKIRQIIIRTSIV